MFQRRKPQVHRPLNGAPPVAAISDRQQVFKGCGWPDLTPIGPEYFDEAAKEKYIPYVIETAVGCDRLALAMLCDVYREEVGAADGEGEGDVRVVMGFKPDFAPVQVAFLPLSKKPPLQEIGNILTGSYLTAMAMATGIVLEPRPPVFARDMLGSVVDAIIAQAAGGSDSVVLLRAAISISNEECDFGLLFLPQPGALETLLQALGVA